MTIHMCTHTRAYHCIAENASQRIKSLRDPTKKMSKSSDDPKSKINVLDEPDILLDRIKKAITDCTSEVTYEPEKRPGVANLITIHSVLTDKMPDQICLEAKGLDTGKYEEPKFTVVFFLFYCLESRFILPLFFFQTDINYYWQI